MTKRQAVAYKALWEAAHGIGTAAAERGKEGWRVAVRYSSHGQWTAVEDVATWERLSTHSR